MGKKEQSKKKIVKALNLMVFSLVKSGYASQKRADFIKQHLLDVPPERCLPVDIRDKKSIERFIREEFPEWSDEWLME